MFEVEMKFRINDYGLMVEKLRSIGVVLDNVGTQRDMIFVSADTIGFSIKPGTPVVRIRSEGDKVSLTLKKKVTAEQSIEHELHISNIDEMAQILECLGLKRIVEVVKRRETAQFDGLMYCLDTVDGLGCFLEIEVVAENDKEVDKAKTIIMECAEKLGLNGNDVEENKYDTLIYNNIKKC